MKFADWQQFAQQITKRAQAVQNIRHDKGWAIAARHDIPRDMCCLHNASIDDDLTGWCKGNLNRLRAAKRAVRIVNNFEISNMANRIISRAWNKVER